MDEERALREQRRREREEQHLYLNLKALSDRQFKAHQGFDLGPFEEKEGQAPETIPFAFRFKKALTLRDLAADFAEKLEVDADKVRLWVMVNRQNKTVRPDQPLLDLDQTVEEAAQKHSNKNDLKLWVEVLDETQAANMKEPGQSHIMVFLKHYDPLAKTLKGAGHVYMKKTEKVGDLFPLINKMMGWPSDTQLKLYEV